MKKGKLLLAAVCAVAALLFAAEVPAAYATEEDVISSAASLDLAAGSVMITQADGVTTFQQGTTVIRTTAGEGIIRQTNSTTATANRIHVKSGTVALTIVDLNVAPTFDSAIMVYEGAELTLTLVGESTFRSAEGYAGIEAVSLLTIQGQGSLAVTGGEYGTGVYGTKLVIAGGTVTATGGDWRAGISGEEIVITGGTVTATGGIHGAGIGSSWDKTITISGGTVTAIGGSNGAGIGGGNEERGGVITINGGTVIATGTYGGAGIGGGNYGYGGTITINGGTVTAAGGDSGAGIGSGFGGYGGTVEISGGTVTATGGESGGAGIGGGCAHSWGGGTGGTVTISGGTVTAVGGGCAAGIGGGEAYNGNTGGNGGSVAISNAEVTAKGYYYAIGGGALGNEYGCDSITIDDSAAVELSYSHYRGENCLEKIIINRQSLDSAALLGNKAVFSVDAYGHSGLSYQWRVWDGSVWSALEGRTAASGESLPLTGENQSWGYDCKLTNGWGNVIYTDTVQAFVLAFTQQPTDVETGLSDTVSLAVKASCDNVTYQWQRSYDEGATWSDVAGEVYATLIVSATLSENDALYRCVITATNGDSPASDSARITVLSDAVTYTTEYYCEKPDGSGYVLTDRVVTESAAGSNVTALPKTYEHFAENTAKGVISGTVTADNSLTLKRYYDRVSYTISFEMNGGAAEAAITARYGAAVTAPPNPTRAGYTFAGWYADEALTEGFTFGTMPGENVTVYAAWDAIGAGRGIEYDIVSISLLDGNYQPLTKIPKGRFYAEVSVKNLSSATMDVLMLATYDANGRFLGMQYLRANPPVGYTFVLGATIDNTGGEIATIKAFMVPALGGMIPLAEAETFGK